MQRDEDRAAALDRLVDAVVEELAEEGEQRVERRREADVGGHVRDEQRLVGRGAAGGTPSTGGIGQGVRVGGARRTRSAPWVRTGTRAAAIGGRVRRGLVDDQVADHPGLGVEDVARLLGVGGRPGRAEAGRDASAGRKTSASSAAGRPGRRHRTSPARDQVVARAVDGPQARRRPAGSGAGSAAYRPGRRTGRSGRACSRRAASAILICLRMKARSDALTVNPCPTRRRGGLREGDAQRLEPHGDRNDQGAHGRDEGSCPGVTSARRRRGR